MLPTMPTENPMSTIHIRRQALLATALTGLALLCRPAAAIDLPRLDDLRPKWDAVALGDTPEQVLQRMGNPNRRTELQTLGVARLDLVWKDIRGPLYTARFLAGRLYAKEMTDSP